MSIEINTKLFEIRNVGEEFLLVGRNGTKMQSKTVLLNNTAALILECINKKMNKKDIVNYLTVRFDKIDAKRIEHEVTDIINKMLKSEILLEV